MAWYKLKSIVFNTYPQLLDSWVKVLLSSPASLEFTIFLPILTNAGMRGICHHTPNSQLGPSHSLESQDDQLGKGGWVYPMAVSIYYA
jgi:hypothetical protein